MIRWSPRLIRAGSLLLLIQLTGGCLTPPASPAPGGGLPVRFTTERPVAAENYAGSIVCRGCHGAIYDFWAGTAHARSLAGLAVKGKEGEASCLRCHATGYGTRSGYAGAGRPELAAVGCEACHGPSAGHAAEPRQIPPSGSLRAGCPPCTVNEVCRLCHTPTWSPAFTPAQYFDTVKCPPER